MAHRFAPGACAAAGAASTHSCIAAPSRHSPPLPGCDRLESFGELCAHKSDPFAPLAALKQLQSLDYSRCALEQLPPWLGTLPNLTQLLLADNQLTSLPTSWGAVVPAGAAGTPAAAVAAGTAPQPAAGGQRGGAAGTGAAAPPVALPPALRHLELQGNPFAVLPAALLASEAARLTHLDLSRWVCFRLTAASALAVRMCCCACVGGAGEWQRGQTRPAACPLRRPTPSVRYCEPAPVFHSSTAGATS